MNTDRELLALAAKSIGLDIEFPITRSGEPYPCRASDMLPWNPLTDDGDALRLAVRLHIDIRHFMYERGEMDCIVDRLGRSFREPLGDDPDAATRRAIVRAAAEIGRSLP